MKINFSWHPFASHINTMVMHQSITKNPLEHNDMDHDDESKTGSQHETSLLSNDQIKTQNNETVNKLFHA